MSINEKMKFVSAILAVFLVLPIWFYLLHEILERVNASELMWFLFWVYIPAHILLSIVSNLMEK